MRFTLFVSAFFFCIGALGEVPDPVITTMSSYNGYATIAGRLNAKATGPVGISVRNGNLMYSTHTDAEGRWGIVIRHSAVNVAVQSWDFLNPAEKNREKEYSLEVKAEASELPPKE